MKKASVIMIYNNKEKADEAIGYVKSQSIADDTEIIALDNSDGKFSSAAKGLNYGAEKATGEVLVFIHQDMLLTDGKCLEKYYEYLSGKDNVVAGAVGYSVSQKKVVSEIFRWKEKVKNIPTADWQISEVYSVDECMFACPKKLWERIKFDEETCDNWHLYAVDMCYANSLSGGKNVIIPVEVWHKSTPGVSFNATYFNSLKRFMLKYRGKVQYVYAPCSTLKCTLCAFRKYTLKRKIKKIFHR